MFNVSRVQCHTTAATDKLAEDQAESYLGSSRRLGDMLRLMLQFWLLRRVATSLTLCSSASNMNTTPQHLTAASHTRDRILQSA